MLKLAAWTALLVACTKSEAPDWSAVALDDTVESSVLSATFEIKLPKGWKRDVNEPSLKAWRPDVKDYPRAPSVAVGYVQRPPANLDAYMASLALESAPIVDNKLMTADFLVVVRHTADNGVVKVDYMTHEGETYVGCSAFQMTSGGVPNPKATMEWLERICKTVTIKKPTRD